MVNLRRIIVLSTQRCHDFGSESENTSEKAFSLGRVFLLVCLRIFSIRFACNAE